MKRAHCAATPSRTTCCLVTARSISSSSSGESMAPPRLFHAQYLTPFRSTSSGTNFTLSREDILVPSVAAIDSGNYGGYARTDCQAQVRFHVTVEGSAQAELTALHHRCNRLRRLATRLGRIHPRRISSAMFSSGTSSQVSSLEGVRRRPSRAFR